MSSLKNEYDSQVLTMIKVLYVDDELDLLDVAKLFLEEEGFEVETTASVKEAISLVSRGDYDIIISDYEMPEMNGIEFLKIIRKNFGSIPFILFTGKGRESVVIEAINNGANFYVQKGGDIDSMFAMLKQKIVDGVINERRSINLDTIINFLIYMVGSNYVEVEEILKMACRLLKVDGVYTAFKEDNKLKIRHSLGIINKAYLEMVVSKGKGMGWQVFSSGKGMIVNNYFVNDKIDHEAIVDDAVRKEGIVSGIAVPISSPTGNLGILYFFTRTKREFSQEDLKLLSSFGSLIGIEINKQKIMREQEKLNNNLIETNKKLNLMSSNTRHGINNQITAIYGLLGLITEGTEETKTKEYLLRIQNILDIMKLDIINTELYQKNGINNPQWYSTIEMEKHFSKIYPNILIVNNAKDLEIYADSSLMLAVNNLIDNTLRHGEKATKIIISYQILPDGKLLFFYEDDGIGIKDEEKDKSFDPGFGKNTGQGLSLVKEILAVAKIEIKETGEFGKGVRFEALIPVGIYRIKQ